MLMRLRHSRPINNYQFNVLDYHYYQELNNFQFSEVYTELGVSIVLQKTI